ncbi:MAG: hypothetical protein ACTSRD_09545, partial [Promethearchaeota archaeon]
MSTEHQKSTDQMINEKVFPAIILGLSLVSFILYFVTDFGGWYIYGPEIYRYVWMFSEMVWWSFIWMLPLASSFAVTGFFALMTLIKPESKYSNKFNQMFLISVGAAGVSILAAIIFILTVLDVTNWWLDAAFWAGLIGGGLNALFTYLILKSR